MHITTTKNQFKQTFNSVFELSSYIDATAGKIPAGSSSITEKANMSVTETHRRAREGGRWPEGASRIEPITIDLADFDIHSLDMPQPHAAMVGYRPSVPAYLAGSPMSMIRQEPVSQPNRLLRVAVHVGKQFGTKQETTFDRGNAILSCLNALSAAGMAIELWAVWRNADHAGNSVHIDTCIKQAEDTYSPDSIAFALCNDGFQRRLAWHCLEAANETVDRKECRAPQNVIDAGYGNGTGANFDDFDVSFGYCKNSERWHGPAGIEKAKAIFVKALGGAS